MGIFTKKPEKTEAAVSEVPVMETSIVDEIEVAVTEADIFDDFDKEVSEKNREIVLPSTTSVIPEGIVLSGNFVSEGDILIGGKLNGNISTSGDVYVSPKGEYKGILNAKNLYAEGVMELTAKIEDTTHLAKTAVVNGNMITTNIDAEHGAVYSGKLNLRTQPEKKEPEGFVQQ